ncbi:MAG: hypothetical protein AB7P99_17190, partial [Vicinamibacterales bacterium]
MWRPASAGLLTLLLLATTSSAQQREAVVTRATGPVVLDGALDEADWRTAPPIGELVQRQPRPGTEPSERTQVTVLRDDANLY